MFLDSPISLDLVAKFFISYGVVRLVTPACISIALCYGIVDKPDGKLKCHPKITPYLGGIVVTIGIFAGALFLPELVWPLSLLCGTITLLCVGLFDDICVLSPLRKFFGQLIASLFLWGGGGTFSALIASFLDQFFSGPLALAIGHCGEILWYLIVINAFNLVDIMDGLAATLGCVCAVGIALVAQASDQAFLLSLSVCCFGALVGFLYFNLPPASIYLGDAGSMFLGGFLAYLASNIAWENLNHALPTYQFALIALSIIFFIPICEIFMLILIRSFHGIPFFRGSKHHFINYLRNNNFKDYLILKIIILIHMILLLILLQLLYRFFETNFLLKTWFVVTAAWIAIVYILPQSFWKKIGIND